MGIQGLLKNADITLDAVFPTKSAVMAFAADRLAANSGMAYDDVKAALAGREALGSTAVGHGIAVPHSLSPYCTEPTATLVRLADPIFFNAPDGLDVNIVFALIWPSSAGQFHKTVAGICRLMRDPLVLKTLRSVDHSEAIREVLLHSTCPNAAMSTKRLALI